MDAGPSVILDGGGGIEPPPNGPELCPEGPCNYQTQVGCSEGQSCWPAIAGDGVEPRCQSTTGVGATGDACASWNDCAPGYLCAAGACRRLCCGGDWTGCEVGESCIRQLNVPIEGEAVSADVDLCFPVGTCDVLDLDSDVCGEDRTCQIVDPTGAEACAPAGAGTLGDACAPDNPCIAGFSCVGGNCRRLCHAVELEPDDPLPCPPEEGICIHFDRLPQGVGECTPFRDAPEDEADAG